MAVRIQNVSRSRCAYGGNGAITYSRTLKLYTDHPPGTGASDQETQIFLALAALANPFAVGQVHPVDPNAICTDLDLVCVKRHEKQGGATFWEWEATANYANQYAQLPSSDPDPTNHQPKINVSQEQRKIGAPVDVNEQVVANSAGEPIPIDKDQAFNVFDIELALSGFEYAWTLDANFNKNGLLNSVNDADITIPFSLTGMPDVVIGKDEGLMRVLRVSPLQANGTTYAMATIQILHDPNKHATLLIDQGFMENQTNPTTSEVKTVPILVGGTTPNVPRLLDGAGSQIDLTDPAAQPVILNFFFNQERTWDFLANALSKFS